MNANGSASPSHLHFKASGHDHTGMHANESANVSLDDPETAAHDHGGAHRLLSNADSGPVPGAAGEAHGGEHHDGGHHHCLSYVRYTCQPGEYDEMATLLLTNAEAAVQHLLS